MSLSNIFSSLVPTEAVERKVHEAISWSFILSGFSLVIVSFFVRSPYGRYARPGWGPQMSAKLGWIIQESPAFIVFALMFFVYGRSQLVDSPVNRVFAALFLWHYFYRSFIYPLHMRGASPPILTVALAWVFCSVNGYLQARHVSFLATPYPATWLADPRFLIGVCLFCLGWYINYSSDNILLNLRKPGETGYKIPRGGAFEYVSAANYFGEILEWWGWALATWSFSGLAFAVFVSCFIGTRGLQHHQWYLEKFKGDYPKHRKALIPFIL